MADQNGFKIKCETCRVDFLLTTQQSGTNEKPSHCPNCDHQAPPFPHAFFNDFLYFSNGFAPYSLKEIHGGSLLGWVSKFFRLTDPFLSFILTAISIALSGLYLRSPQITGSHILTLVLTVLALSLLAAAIGMIIRRLTLALTLLLPLMFHTALVLGLSAFHHPVSAIGSQVLKAVVAAILMRLFWRPHKANLIIPLVLCALFLLSPSIFWPLSTSKGVLASAFLLTAVVAAIHGLFATGVYQAAALRFFFYACGLFFLFYLFSATGGVFWRYVLMLGGSGAIAWGVGELEKNHSYLWFLPWVNRWDCRAHLMTRRSLSNRSKKYFIGNLTLFAQAPSWLPVSLMDKNLWLAARSISLKQQFNEILKQTAKTQLLTPWKPVNNTPTGNYPVSGRAVYNYYGNLFLNSIVPDIEAEKGDRFPPSHLRETTSDYLTAIRHAVERRDQEDTWTRFVTQWTKPNQRDFYESRQFIQFLKLNGMHFEALDLMDTYSRQCQPQEHREILFKLMVDMEVAISTRMGWARDVVLQTPARDAGPEKDFRLRIYNNTRDLTGDRHNPAPTTGTHMRIWIEGQYSQSFELAVDEGCFIDTPPGNYKLFAYFRGITVPLLRAQWRVEDSGARNLSMLLPGFNQNR